MRFGGGIFSDYLTLPWEEAREYIKEELEQLRAALQSHLNSVFNSDGTVTEEAFGGAGGDIPSYLANTGTKRSPKWEKVDLANGVKNRIAYASLPQATPGQDSLIAHSAGVNFQEIEINGEDIAIDSGEIILTDTPVTPGTYGDSLTVPQVTVDQKGRLTEVVAVPIEFPVATATLSDGDYGDVTVSGSGTVLTVDADVVTNTKLANMAAATIKGSVAGGDPADLDADDASDILDGAADPFIRTSAASSGALVLLEQYTASSSASLNFTTCISATYDEYMIEFVGVILATDGADFRMRMSTDGGSSYDSGNNYAWAANQTAPAFTGPIGANTAAFIVLFNAFDTTVSQSSMSGSWKLFNTGSTALYKGVVGQMSAWKNDGNFFNNTGAGFYKITTAVNAFQFLSSSGNIASGTIRVYGVAK